MMNLIRYAASFFLAIVSLPTVAAVEPGQPAPAFTLKNLAGEAVSLDQFKGKVVVLEWNNPNCPFVRKHYDSGNMQKLQVAASGTVWLSINSTNTTSSDYMDPAALGKWVAAQKASPTAYLMDSDGKVGRAYGAKTTPHMYVIDASGVLAYMGAIDDKRSTNPADVATSANHVRPALDAVAQGKAVANPSTAPYGCSIKY